MTQAKAWLFTRATQSRTAFGVATNEWGPMKRPWNCSEFAAKARGFRRTQIAAVVAQLLRIRYM